MRPISDTLYELLMAQGMCAGSLAGDDARGIGDGGHAGKSAPRHQPADREDNQPMGVRLCWVNPHMTKATGRKSSAALVICE